MDYENIVEIIELEHHSEVNKYLNCGWLLLSASVAVAPYGNQGVEKKSIYSIGWNKKNGEVQYPPKPKEDETTKKLRERLRRLSCEGNVN
ncbi:MAG: hypothetical protein K2J39_11580 [Ruminococcus sp.]|nr:hypothetical protein [Ruminococcus sp.]